MSAKQRQALLTIVAAVVLALLGWWLNSGSGSDPSGSDHSQPARATVSATPTSPSTTGSAEEPSDPADVDPDSGLRWVDLATLPPKAQQVAEAIDAGGPFDYPGKDGSTFGNFEGILPDHQRGYYREYTVELSNGNRGPWRIVTGERGEWYWTADHYESFERIRR